jgi:dynein heavy chain
MRTWDTYLTLEATVKNMLTSLRAVGELQNSAIRERHWQQLMKSTKVMIQCSLLMLCSYYIFMNYFNFILSAIFFHDCLYVVLVTVLFSLSHALKLLSVHIPVFSA